MNYKTKAHKEKQRRNRNGNPDKNNNNESAERKRKKTIHKFTLIDSKTPTTIIKRKKICSIVDVEVRFTSTFFTAN